MESFIEWFDRPGADDSLLGPKNACLRSLTLAGLPVPAGFAVTTGAYRRAVAEAGLHTHIAALTAAADQADLIRRAERVRAAILGTAPPDWLREQVTRAYATLSRRCRGRAVAVRSSATCEDRPGASFAGAHDTFLGVTSADQVVRQLIRCWASLYSERAVSYRMRMLGPNTDVAMSVGVQVMVRPRTAGVAITLNPVDGDRSVVAIDAAWGSGEAVVSGTVTPDHFLVERSGMAIRRRVVSRKHVEHRVRADGTAEVVAVDSDRLDQPCLCDDEVRAVADIACRAEAQFGRPQDVEWALDSRPGARESLWLLQSRPETVWLD